jgi:hypothetical protein
MQVDENLHAKTVDEIQVMHKTNRSFYRGKLGFSSRKSSDSAVFDLNQIGPELKSKTENQFLLG